MGKIQTPRARTSDAPFLARLDSFSYLGETAEAYRLERLAYWQQALAADNPESPNVHVARECGGYLGYVAVLANSLDGSHDLCLGPLVRDEVSVRSALMKHVQVLELPFQPEATISSNDMAVA